MKNDNLLALVLVLFLIFLLAISSVHLVKAAKQNIENFNKEKSEIIKI